MKQKNRIDRWKISYPFEFRECRGSCDGQIGFLMVILIFYRMERGHRVAPALANAIVAWGCVPARLN
jgi:hypothetical protein